MENDPLFAEALPLVQDADLMVEYFTSRSLYDIYFALSQLVLPTFDSHLLLVSRVNLQRLIQLSSGSSIAFHFLGVVVNLFRCGQRQFVSFVLEDVLLRFQSYVVYNI